MAFFICFCCFCCSDVRSPAPSQEFGAGRKKNMFQNLPIGFMTEEGPKMNGKFKRAPAPSPKSLVVRAGRDSFLALKLPELWHLLLLFCAPMSEAAS